MSNLIRKIHHSLADWDYRVGAKLELSSDRYISPPTSLRTQNLASGSQIESIYLGDILGLNIPEGRMITYYRRDGIYGSRFYFMFRCQDKKYTDLPDDCYYFLSLGSSFILYRREAGSDTEVHREGLDPILRVGQWYRFRITWYQYIEEDLHKYLHSIVEREEAGVFVEVFNWKDEINMWADSPTNRLGFQLEARPDPNYIWIDDTGIWQRT
ncbi:hypothetical protein ES703_95491 [subsurface metagenome]